MVPLCLPYFFDIFITLAAAKGGVASWTPHIFILYFSINLKAPKGDFNGLLDSPRVHQNGRVAI
jgi:hypothetical protein